MHLRCAMKSRSRLPVSLRGGSVAGSTMDLERQSFSILNWLYRLLTTHFPPSQWICTRYTTYPCVVHGVTNGHQGLLCERGLTLRVLESSLISLPKIFI